MTNHQRVGKLLAAGLCGFCGKKRERFRFLCDGCAEKHRERQRSNRPRNSTPFPAPVELRVARLNYGQPAAMKGGRRAP